MIRSVKVPQIPRRDERGGPGRLGFTCCCLCRICVCKMHRNQKSNKLSTRLPKIHGRVIRSRSTQLGRSLWITRFTNGSRVKSLKTLCMKIPQHAVSVPPRQSCTSLPDRSFVMLSESLRNCVFKKKKKQEGKGQVHYLSVIGVIRRHLKDYDCNLKCRNLRLHSVEKSVCCLHLKCLFFP